MKNFKLREQAIQKEKGRMGSEHEHLSHGRLFCDVSRKDHRAVHAKDTSKKIRSVLKAKGNSGKHLSVIPPFGYKKDPNDKEKWTVTYFYGYSIIDYSVFTYSHFRQII